MAEEIREFTVEDLASFNGENGAPVYVAFEGRVFDVTASKLWRGGMHMKRHPAGRDLTAEMQAAPHDVTVLDRFPQVGVLVAAEATWPMGPGLPPVLEQFLERHPFFRRHPHPMTVHFPIVSFIFAPVFTLLYLVTGYGGFETTALDCLAAGLFFCLIVIPTGLITGWINYGARPMQPVTIKIVVSLCMFVDGLAVLLWRLLEPSVITGAQVARILFLALEFLLLPMVVVVAWLGATLTFPLGRKKRTGTGGP